MAFVVGKLSQYTSNPSHIHQLRVRRILIYLKKTINYGINYCGYSFVLEGHTDASWIDNSEDHS